MRTTVTIDRKKKKGGVPRMGQKEGKRWEMVVERDEEVMSWHFGCIPATFG
jgi:hypothetical protein